MKRFNDFYEAYNWLSVHPLCKCKSYSQVYKQVVNYELNYFYRCLDVSVVKVNPWNGAMENDMSLNTKTQIWLEFGKAFLDLDESEHVLFEHDADLDCGANTFEEAIVILANLVDEYYGDSKEREQEL